MDPKVWQEIDALKREIALLKARDHATYNTIYSATEPTDHFMNETLDSAWSWSGSNVPSTVDLSSFPSHLLLSDDTNGGDFHLVRTFSYSTPRVAIRLMPGNRQWIGLRLDDNTANNLLIFRCRQALGRTMLTYYAIDGGVTLAANVHILEVPVGPITLVIYHDQSTAYLYYSTEPHLINGSFHGLQLLRSFALTATFTRWGPQFYNDQNVGDDVDFRGAIDWASQSNVGPTGDAATYVGYHPIAARYTTNAGQTFGTGSAAVVNFEDVTYDPYSLVTTGAAWVFTCPVTGWYQVNCSLLWASTTAWAAGEANAMYFRRNGSDVAIPWRSDSNNLTSGAATLVGMQGSDAIYCNIGDTLAIAAEQGSGGNLALHNNGSFNFVSIAKLPW